MSYLVHENALYTTDVPELLTRFHETDPVVIVSPKHPDEREEIKDHCRTQGIPFAGLYTLNGHFTAPHLVALVNNWKVHTLIGVDPAWRDYATELKLNYIDLGPTT